MKCWLHCFDPSVAETATLVASFRIRLDWFLKFSFTKTKFHKPSFVDSSKAYLFSLSFTLKYLFTYFYFFIFFIFHFLLILVFPGCPIGKNNSSKVFLLLLSFTLKYFVFLFLLLLICLFILYFRLPYW